MNIDLTTLLVELGNTESVDSEFVLEDSSFEDSNAITPVKVTLSLMNSGHGVLATGSIRTTLQHRCAMCANLFEESIEISIDERFVELIADDAEWLAGHDKTEEGVELLEEDGCFTYENNIIEVEPFLRELLILNLPIAPKCDINCRIKHDPEKKRVDPRFKILEKLKNGGIADGST
jgi:uncharacterized protein